MQYRKLGKCGFEVSALGYGIMRMPIIDGDYGKIDEEKSIELIRYAIDRGINYLDTAYNYHMGKSERLVAKALKGGYRDKVKVATKMPTWKIQEYPDFEKIFTEQLNNLETGSIDFYLLHHMNRASWEKCYQMGVLKFLDEKIAEGSIKNIGFSYHDDFEHFKKIIDTYDWDFCQIQYNYLDEYNQAGRKGIEYASSKGLGVIIMEPLRGGDIAVNPTEEVKKLWDSSVIKRTPAEWSLRWIWNHPGVSVILSGMNTMEQINENTTAAEDALPNSMNENELSIVKEVREAYERIRKIGCTGCLYCINCPKWIQISDIFSIYNKMHVYGDVENYRNRYREMLKSSRSPVDCIECGSCEKICPQHLPIRKLLKEAHEALK